MQAITRPKPVMALLLLTVAALALSSCSPTQEVETSVELSEANVVPVTFDPEALPSRPNIILYMADDLGWGDIGLNGADLIKTPNIDQLGEDGVQLTQFYAGANVCTPSRAALLTGRYANRSGMQHVVMPFSQFGLPQSEITIPELLQDAGYATGMVGKWHLGHGAEHWPTEHGFERFYGVPYSNDMQPFDLYRGTEIIQSPADQTQLTANYADEAANFIAENADGPFFLYIAETFPHIPLFVTDENAGRSDAGLYGDVVETMDDGIGRIVDALEEAGVKDNTLIMITSDNGPWFEGDPGHLRGRKGGLHEGGYRVPFIAHWPQGLPSGAVIDEMAMGIDMLPTLANLVDVDMLEDRTIDGRDILPMMRGEAETPHDVLFFFEGNDIAAVRDPRFRLSLQTYYKTFRVPFEQFGDPILYDLSIDQEERFSFNREYPDVVERLMVSVNAMREDLKGTEIEPQSPFGPPSPDTPIGPRLGPAQPSETDE
ncbi:MAG: sulfatase [Pseudomonadota bacterium]